LGSAVVVDDDDDVEDRFIPSFLLSGGFEIFYVLSFFGQTSSVD
jgi:hypothetical protein